MSNAVLQLLVLAGVAVFLILKLRSVLGTRDGFESPIQPLESKANQPERNFEVIDGGVDYDISDHVAVDSDAGQAITKFKKAEPGFLLTEFLGGARQAYEMILMAFENDDRETLERFLAKDVYDGFSAALDERADKGLVVEAEFIGLREIKIIDAAFAETSKIAEITLKFFGEITSVVKDIDGKIVEGSKTKIKKQNNIWTFERKMGSEDPNWTLIATGA